MNVSGTKIDAAQFKSLEVLKEVMMAFKEAKAGKNMETQLGNVLEKASTEALNDL